MILLERVFEVHLPVSSISYLALVIITTDSEPAIRFFYFTKHPHLTFFEPNVPRVRCTVSCWFLTLIEMVEPFFFKLQNIQMPLAPCSPLQSTKRSKICWAHVPFWRHHFPSERVRPTTNVLQHRPISITDGKKNR